MLRSRARPRGHRSTPPCAGPRPTWPTRQTAGGRLGPRRGRILEDPPRRRARLHASTSPAGWSGGDAMTRRLATLGALPTGETSSSNSSGGLLAATYRDLRHWRLGLFEATVGPYAGAFDARPEFRSPGPLPATGETDLPGCPGKNSIESGRVTRLSTGSSPRRDSASPRLRRSTARSSGARLRRLAPATLGCPSP